MTIPTRYSLRLLLSLVTVSALACLFESRREANRSHLVKAIERDGGKVTFIDASWPTPFPTRRISSVTIPYMAMDRYSDDQLSVLVNLKEIVIPDVQCPCPGEVKKRPPSCLVPMVLEIPLCVSPDAKDLLAKIRSRQDRLSAREVKRWYREDKAGG